MPDHDDLVASDGVPTPHAKDPYRDSLTTFNQYRGLIFSIGIIITPPAFLLCYLLAASELCIAVISWGARQLTDPKAIRAIVAGFIVS
jgi:hypothetical protein